MPCFSSGCGALPLEPGPTVLMVAAYRFLASRHYNKARPKVDAAVCDTGHGIGRESARNSLTNCLIWQEGGRRDNQSPAAIGSPCARLRYWRQVYIGMPAMNTRKPQKIACWPVP